MNQLAQDHYRDNEREQPNNDIVFCTSCGKKLDDYCFSPQSKNLTTVKDHLADCKKSGRYSGGICARFFIASPEDLI